MNVVPAQVGGRRAGGRRLAAAAAQRRPAASGILAACALLGITEVYAVGGAQAIAPLAYGTAELDQST